MRNFPEHTDLGDGYSWTATLDSHDWAMHSKFYFTLRLYRHGVAIRALTVSMDDRMYGDINCKASSDEIAQHVYGVLHANARQEASSVSEAV